MQKIISHNKTSTLKNIIKHNSFYSNDYFFNKFCNLLGIIFYYK